MNSRQVCPLCEARIANIESIPDGMKIECDGCGHFAITGSADSELQRRDRRLKQKIGFWTRDQNDLGEDRPKVTSHTISMVEKLPEKTIIERVERLLRLGIREQKDLGATFPIHRPGVMTATHSRSVNEVTALAHPSRSRLD
jgi:hypothetical protein